MLEGRLSDMRVPLLEVGHTLRDMVASEFASQGAVGATGKWTELSPAYRAFKERHVPGLPILVGIRPTGGKRQRPQSYARSGAMRLSLLEPGAMHVGRQRLLYAPTSDYAGYHETGTGKMPARPPVDPRLSDLRLFDRIFVAWVARLARQSGL